MNKKFKALFVDLDGTSLDTKIKNRLSLSNKNKKAIADARENGIEVVVSTGRIGWTATRIIDEFGGNYFIQGNGSLVTDKNNKIIYEKKMTLRQVAQILDFAQSKKMILRPSLDNKAYGVSTPLRKKIAKGFGTDFAHGYTMDTSIERHKILLIGWPIKRMINKAVKELKSKFKDLIIVTSANGYMIEITAQDASKGYAAKIVMDKLKISKKYTAHIGDTMNDSTAKGYVGKLIAMKNADKNLKKIAHFIGPSYKNGGLAKVINGQYKIKK